MNKSNSKAVVLTATIAALYTVFVYVLYPLSYGPLQLRMANILYPVILYNPLFSLGFGLGVFLANLGSPFGALDFIIMPFVTIFACYLAWLLRSKPIIALVTQALIISIGVAFFPLYLGAGIDMLITFPGILISQLIIIIPAWYLIWKPLGYFFNGRINGT